jgi:hypothetical protein
MEHSLKISNISYTQLSIVKYYGSCIINGKEYVYNAQTDELDLKVKVKKPNKKPYISNQFKIDL